MVLFLVTLAAFVLYFIQSFVTILSIGLNFDRYHAHVHALFSNGVHRLWHALIKTKCYKEERGGESW